MTAGAEEFPEAEVVLPATAPLTAPDEQATLRLYAERLNVEHRTTQLHVVRASSVTEEREHEVNETLSIETVEVAHVAIGRIVGACPPVRVEGDTTILSIVEEVVVVERRLVLKEEIHLTKVRTATSHREIVKLREQHAVISREPISSSDERRHRQDRSTQKEL